MKQKFKESYYGLSVGATVNAAECCIENPKLWGKVSKNRLRFTPKALASAVKLSENAVVHIDHSNYKQQFGEAPVRSVGDIFGVIKEPYLDANGELRAKRFEWNPNHPYAVNFLWAVQNTPDKIGFSVSADGDAILDPATNEKIVQEVYYVDGFDIVSNPANTGGILEQTQENQKMDLTNASLEELFAAITTKIMSDSSLDLATKKAKINSIMKMLDDGTDVVDSTVTADPETPEETVIQEATKFKSPLIKHLVKMVKGLKLRESLHARVDVARKQLPDQWITTSLKNALANAKTDEEVTTLIVEQVKLKEAATINSMPNVVTTTIARQPEPTAQPFDKAKAEQTLFG